MTGQTRTLSHCQSNSEGLGGDGPFRDELSL